MKTLLLLPLVLTIPAFAGSTSKEVIAPPPASPCLTSWFAGGSVGYLTEFDEPMYNIHLGVTNSCWALGGGTFSIFAEVGYTESDESGNWDGLRVNPNDEDYYDLDGADVEVDVQIVPITLNVKYDHVISGNLNAYIGGGIGVAWMDIDASISTDEFDAEASDDDWVFTAQIFGGLSYNVSSTCEIYGGARWIYYDDPSIAGETISVDDDCLLELGARFKF